MSAALQYYLRNLSLCANLRWNLNKLIDATTSSTNSKSSCFIIDYSTFIVYIHIFGRPAMSGMPDRKSTFVSVTIPGDMWLHASVCL